MCADRRLKCALAPDQTLPGTVHLAFPEGDPKSTTRHKSFNEAFAHQDARGGVLVAAALRLDLQDLAAFEQRGQRRSGRALELKGAARVKRFAVSGEHLVQLAVEFDYRGVL